MQTLSFLVLCVIAWQLFRLERAVRELDAPVPVLPYAPDFGVLSPFAIPSDGVCRGTGDVPADRSCDPAVPESGGE